MYISAENRTVAGVPVLEFYPAGDGRKHPLIFILHGFSGRKEDNLATAYAFARQGYTAVALDLHRHGELGQQPFNPAEAAPHFAEIVAQSSRSLAGLVEAYQAEERPVDASRMGLLGISLGGAVIHAYLPQRAPQVKTAVVMIAGLPSFVGVTFRRIQQVFPHFGVTDALVESLSAWGSGVPLLENVRDFPLLWQYGSLDPILPIQSVRGDYQRVRSRYTRPELFELVEHENCGHETPPAMYTRALDWFARYL